MGLSVKFFHIMVGRSRRDRPAFVALVLNNVETFLRIGKGNCQFYFFRKVTEYTENGIFHDFAQ
jgi:hypothetical protein